MTALVILLAIGGTVTPGPVAHGPELANPATLAHRYGLSIAIRKGQQVVVDVQRDAAPKVIVALKAPFESVEPTLREIIKKHFGEASFAEAITSDLDAWHKEFGHFANDLRDKNLERLGLLRIRLGRFREARINSQKYNVLWFGRGHSEVVLRIIDGRDVFSDVSTLVVLQRRDEVYEWGWEYHFPIPSYAERRANLVTDQELALIHDLLKVVRVKAAYFTLGEQMSLLADSEVLIRAARWLKKP